MKKKEPCNPEGFQQNVQGCIYRTAKAGSWVFTFEDKGLSMSHSGEKAASWRKGGRKDYRCERGRNREHFLLPRKHESMADDAERIYSYLLERNGAMPYSDKSPPEVIRARFGMSKGAFKRALGKLMKEGKVYQEGMWTYAVKKE